MFLSFLALHLLSPPPAEASGAYEDITYRTVGDWHGQLDILIPSASGTRPALLYFHGGEWRGGSRKAVADHLQPYVGRGFVVVAVDYRGAKTALAPAAVTDARCAYHWIVNNASKYRIDPSRIVLSGHSAGGHLALMVGYLGKSSSLDADCRIRRQVRPMAVVSWNAPTDLREYMALRASSGDPIEWLKGMQSAPAQADAISPLIRVRKGAVPTVMVHAAGDPEVPYSQAVRLQDRLEAARVRNRLVTLESSGHLTAEHPQPELERAYSEVFGFLDSVCGKKCRPA